MLQSINLSIRAASFYTKLIATRTGSGFVYFYLILLRVFSLIHLWTNNGWIHWRTKGLEVHPPGANNLKSKERFLERSGRIVSKAVSKRVEGLYRSFYCCEEEVEHSSISTLSFCRSRGEWDSPRSHDFRH